MFVVFVVFWLSARLVLVERLDPSLFDVLPPFMLPLVELLFWLLARLVERLALSLPPLLLPLVELLF